MSSSLFNKVRIVDFFDAPEVLQASGGTPIPGNVSAPLQVVASLLTECNRLVVLDGMGEYVGVYVGAPGQEVLECIVGGGVPSIISTFLPAGARISLRNMLASPITVGTLCIQFGVQQ